MSVIAGCPQGESWLYGNPIISGFLLVSALTSSSVKSRTFLLFSEMNRFATDDHGALMSYLEEPTLFMAKGEVGGGGGGGGRIFKIRVGWACVSNSTLKLFWG